MTALPRSIVLEGASNVRDLGGYRTKDGAQVRFGQVFRSAALSKLTAGDAARLREAGIGVVCDLRGEAERLQAPSLLPGVALHALSIDPSLGRSIRELADDPATEEDDIAALMRRAYAAYATVWAHRYHALFALLADPTTPGLLFHCTAGKDRTGFGAALILAALGVDRATVQADYLATNRLWTADPEIAAALPPRAAAVLLRVQADFLDSAFAAVLGASGSVDAYLEEHIGVTPAVRAALRARLLE